MTTSGLIDRAFASNAQLKKRIFDAIDATPQHGTLFEDIARYHLDYSQNHLNGSSSSSAAAGADEPASKKRKLANGSLPINANAAQKDQPREVILEARDISFSLPQRKKLHLGIAQYGTDIHEPATSFALFTRNPATNQVDMEIPLDRFAYALRLPVPEKAAKQFNFCLLPKAEDGAVDPVIWTVNDGPLKSLVISSPALAKVAPGPEDMLENALKFILQRSGIDLTLPTADEFASANPEAHRKGDKAYHVKAFRGSKDGFLFFLRNGIFFGFKKPLAFFPFEDVESISYTSVLQRTFNLNIAYRPSGDVDGNADAMDAIEETEFSMLDQADFPGIDAYIKRHGLQDASLAESRRAKKLKAAANGKATTKNGAADDEDEDDTRTELEKAQQQLEDEEDEEEEDYDPGSDDESDGSGASDDEDDDEVYERERKKAKGRNLVAEELGSEAEDVSATEDEEGGEEEEEGDEEEQEEEQEQEGEQPVVEGEENYDEEEEGEEEGEEEYGEYDEEEGEEEECDEADEPAAIQGGKPAAAGAVGWHHEEGMPDPDDDDQL